MCRDRTCAIRRRKSRALLKSADQALYVAKHGYGGAIQLYDAGYQDVTRQRRNVERDLRHALRRNEFFLVFQPIFALSDNRVAGCEALLRWRHPTLGVRSPSEFVHIMEETGLINEIGQWIFLDACKAAATWPKQTRLAVNVSAIQLRQTNILSSVVNALAASALQPDRLEIEITETAVLDESEQIISNLTALRELEFVLHWMILGQDIPRSLTCGDFHLIVSKSTACL